MTHNRLLVRICQNHRSLYAIVFPKGIRTPDTLIIVMFIYTNSFTGVKLLQAVDKKKDQTLFLSQISQDSLRKTLFPIGDLTKDAVRKIAVSAGLEKIAKRKEVLLMIFFRLSLKRRTLFISTLCVIILILKMPPKCLRDSIVQ